MKRIKWLRLYRFARQAYRNPTEQWTVDRVTEFARAMRVRRAKLMAQLAVEAVAWVVELKSWPQLRQRVAQGDRLYRLHQRRAAQAAALSQAA